MSRTASSSCPEAGCETKYRFPLFDERRILDAAFATHIRERDHGEAIRGSPEIHGQIS